VECLQRCSISGRGNPILKYHYSGRYFTYLVAWYRGQKPHILVASHCTPSFGVASVVSSL
jgi:hypothetical protein